MSVEWVIAMMVLGFFLGYSFRKSKQKQRLVRPKENVVEKREHTSPQEGNVYPLSTFRSSRRPRDSVTIIDAHPRVNGVFEATPNPKINGTVARFQDPKLQHLFGEDDGRSKLLEAPVNKNDEQA